MSAENPKPTLRRVGRATFRVSSRTRPGLMHTVDVARLRCDCEAGRNGLRCWHLFWAIQAEFWLDRAATESGAAPL